MSNTPLPGALVKQTPPYVVIGALGLALFTFSGLLWDAHPFWAQLLLELGGGAFIAFLLEFVLPKLRAATGRVRPALKTELAWSHEATETILFDAPVRDRQAIIETLTQRGLPAHVSPRRGVRPALEDARGNLVLAVPSSTFEVVYQVRWRSPLRRTATIHQIVVGSSEPVE